MTRLSLCVLELAFALHSRQRHLKNRTMRRVQATFQVIVLLVAAVVAVVLAVVSHVAVAHVAVASVDHVLGRAQRVWVSTAVQTADLKGVILVFVAAAHAVVDHAAAAALVVAPLADAAPAAVAHVDRVHHAAADHAVDHVHHVDVVPVVPVALAVHAFPLVSPALLILGTNHLAHSPLVPTCDSPRNAVVFSPAI